VFKIVLQTLVFAVVVLKHISKSFRQSLSGRSELLRARIRKWADEKSVSRAGRPTNPLRARTLGYKAKKGYIVVRVRLKRGKRVRPAPNMGRKPGKNVKRVPPGQPLSAIAEGRAARLYSNMRVVNSYLAGQDGVNSYFEVILREKALGN
jgi:large subunit ribosomal protein L15e